MSLRPALIAPALFAAAPALADVNVYTTRQPELIQPVIDAFTDETGIEVNLAFVDEGIVERLRAEGDRSPADLVMTVDIANLQQIVDAGVVQPVDSQVLRDAIPAELRSPDDLWFALTERARIVDWFDKVSSKCPSASRWILSTRTPNCTGRAKCVA